MFKNVIFKKAFMIVLSCLVFVSLQAKSVFNVRDFGAQGNGTSDDRAAFQKCIDKALLSLPAEVFIPGGNYKISGPIVIKFNNGDITLRGEGVKSLIFTNVLKSLLLVQGNPGQAVGTIEIKNLSLRGNSTPYGENPNFNTTSHIYGIGITDKSIVHIENVSISNIYGRAINIANPNSRKKGDNSRFKSVSVLNCKLTDCWGHISSNDSYGDGIYLADLQNGTVTDNEIVNNISKTKYFGRAGIVVTYKAENCKLLRNTIKGYDRGINIEYTYGGHLVKQNVIEGNNTGIMIYENSGRNKVNNVNIEGNVISNKGLNSSFIPPGTTSSKTTPMVGRSLMIISSPNECMKSSVISNNVFMLHQGSRFDGNSLVSLAASGITTSKNKFEIPVQMKNKVNVLINKNMNFTQNEMMGVNIKVAKSFTPISESKLKSDNKLNGGLITR